MNYDLLEKIGLSFYNEEDFFPKEVVLRKGKHTVVWVHRPSGHGILYEIPVKIFVNPVEDPFDFDEEIFPNRIDLSTDDSDDYPIKIIQLTEPEWGGLSDPEYNYDVSLVLLNPDLEPYVTWTIVGSTIQLSVNYGFYGNVPLQLSISDPARTITKDFDLIVNLIEYNDTLCNNYKDITHIDGSTNSYCIGHSHN